MEPFWIPSKINSCIWRAFFDRLPTRAKLVNRGVTLTPHSCVICDSAPEDLKHCFFECQKVLPIWLKIWIWWRLTQQHTLSLDDIIFRNVAPQGNKWVARIFHNICYIFPLGYMKTVVYTLQINHVMLLGMKTYFPWSNDTVFYGWIAEVNM